MTELYPLDRDNPPPGWADWAEQGLLEWRFFVDSLTPFVKCQHGHYDPHRLPTGCSNSGCLVNHIPMNCAGGSLPHNDKNPETGS